MRISEIQQLKSSSPALRMALSQRDVYRFLREQVTSREDCFPQGAHTCEHCGRVVGLTLMSPYNDPHPGWCIDCVLGAYFTPDMPLYEPPEKERPRREGSTHYFVNDGQGWTDQDGNPVEVLPFRFP